MKGGLSTSSRRSGGTLSDWKGRNLTKVGNVILTKLVLSLQPVYLLTALSTTKEVLTQLTNLRKISFGRGIETSRKGTGLNFRGLGGKLCWRLLTQKHQVYFIKVGDIVHLCHVMLLHLTNSTIVFLINIKINLDLTLN